MIIFRVKLGKSLDTNEWCAVKIMKEMSSSSQLEAFMDEVRTLSQCENRQVIHLLSASISGSFSTPHSKKTMAYIVTSYAKFGEVYKLIRETGPLGEPLARTYFFQLIKGLEYLHSLKISHRDVKLENLLIDQDMRLLITDFGCAAKCRTSTDKAISFDSASVVGSKEYNAPEMHCEQHYYGEKVDIFSAGICLFLMAIGHPPFREASLRDTYFKKLARKDKSEYWEIYKSINVSSEFKDLFEKITEKDFSKRIELRDVYSHPWMNGHIYSPEELRAAMHDRIQSYLKMCWRQSREMVKTKKATAAKGKKISPREQSKENSTRGDKTFQNFVLECSEIRRRRELKMSLPDSKSKPLTAESGILMPLGLLSSEETKAA